jgi:hypothetical protein
MMNTFTCYTLVDITQTGVIRDHAGKELERNQQRNWETVLQCIGLRAQPIDIHVLHDPVESADLANYEFGEMYKGKHRVWVFHFVVEHPGVFAKEDDPLYFLDQSFDEVPIITFLTETARFILPIFHTSGPIKNIYFKNTQDLLNI